MAYVHLAEPAVQQPIRRSPRVRARLPPIDDRIASPSSSLPTHEGYRRAHVAGMTKVRCYLPMHRVAFIVYPDFELLDLSGPAAVFDGANHVLAQSGNDPFYAIEIVSKKGGLVTSSSGVTVSSIHHRGLASKSVDTLLVVGTHHEQVLRAAADRSLRAWLPKLAAKVPRLGSVCSGTFLLAAFGMLDGRRVATHWELCAPLAKAFPSVSVESDALYVVDGSIWTSAGVTTGIDMALAMVAHDLDPAIASQIAKGLVLYARRPGHQSQLSPLLKAQAKADSPFADLIEWIHANLDSPLDVPALAARAGLTERTFHRKFVAATGQTPARFVEMVRLDAARMLLSRGLSLKAVSTQVGLFPAARLSEAFERRFGISPSVFREMHAQL
jgi:transcriptional regulator GlxA family with amidase domain